MSKYTLGIDYGTLSARCVLMSCLDGSVAASATKAYPHKVIDQELPDGTKLQGSWALEDADDYLLALKETVRKVMEKAGIPKEDVIGLSVDFTSCTVVAADAREEAAQQPGAVPVPAACLYKAVEASRRSGTGR